MLLQRNFGQVLSCALGVLAIYLSVAALVACAKGNPSGVLSDEQPTAAELIGEERLLDDESLLPDHDARWVDESQFDRLLAEPISGDWSSQWLPTGLIYHPYFAGMHEPRMAIVAFREVDDRSLWDATLGGQVGLWRLGDDNHFRPQGYQLDFYGAAIARLDVENRQDLDSTDYVFGLPLTYGIDDWQFKLGYAHVSSHLGDELAIREPGALAERINYVRDSLVFGTSHFPHPICRLYGELSWAFHCSGGADPLETQFGTELSRPGPTGPWGTPFLALNAHLSQEFDFGGQSTAQFGWLRRGETGQTLRVGVHYFNGKSSQLQFLNDSEQQIGMGLWYDF